MSTFETGRAGGENWNSTFPIDQVFPKGGVVLPNPNKKAGIALGSAPTGLPAAYTSGSIQVRRHTKIGREQAFCTELQVHANVHMHAKWV